MKTALPTLNLSAVDSVDSIARDDFQRDYFSTLKPLVIKNLARDWPAFSKWTPSFFQTVHGDKSVKVYDKSFVTAGKGYMSGAKTMPLADYIEQVLTTPQDLRMFLYNIKSHIPELLNDIRLPDLANGFSKQFVFMFFGCKQAITQMHFDIDMSHVFHTSLHGIKTVTLFPYHQSRNIHRAPFTCRSYIDVDNPDFERFPGLHHALGYRVALYPGDTLYIPAGCWHHMVYDEAGYALSLRCASTKIKDKLQGLYNLTVMQGIDRFMNTVAPSRWESWKRHRAQAVFVR